ncbi:MAG: hypothetical protein H3C62_14580 [Gemmatimonadaceae bacterium]|nr:hypothetical protein [Gemmatimonadaceae bacterium]
MTDQTLTVFVNAHAVQVPPGATALDAVRTFDAAEGEAVAAGRRGVTDSRGLPVAADTAVHGGAIYRLVSARAARSEDAE